MKVLTLTQPWATLVAIGEKRIETRSWKTDYRGPLMIHAAKGFPKYARDVCKFPIFKDALDLCGLDENTLPLGKIIAACELSGVMRITDSDRISNRRIWHTDTGIREVTRQEYTFGDYAIGRYMWFLDNIVALKEPIPVKGHLSLWEFDPVTPL